MIARGCPICGEGAAIERYRPFCSRRCADIDLHRWFSGRYAVPVVEADDEPEDAAPAGEGDGAATSSKGETE